jgi:ankyrin repeat protein
VSANGQPPVDDVRKYNRLLAKAVRSGHVSAIRRLVTVGADVSALASTIADDVFERGCEMRPLHRAVHDENEPVCALLIGLGAGVDDVDNDGMTALNLAVSRAGRAIVDLLLAHGAAIDKGDKDGFTPLHAVARKRSGDECVYLLERGACAMVLSRFKTSALHFAAESNSVASARALIGAGLRPNDLPDRVPDGYLTPFQTAVQYNAVDVVRMMVQEYGEDIEQRTRDGLTMYELAEEREGRTVFELLLSMRSQCGVVGGLPIGDAAAGAARACAPVL